MTQSATENLIRHIFLRQLQIFEAADRLGGYTHGAKTLHLTQPTVSMQVKKLSATIGYPLLEKAGHHLHPTAAGNEVYASAQSILGRMASLGESTAALEGTVKGPLRIANITTAKYFMPHLLGAFITQHPDVKPILKVTNRSRILERLKSREDHLLTMGQLPRGLDGRSMTFCRKQAGGRREHPSSPHAMLIHSIAAAEQKTFSGSRSRLRNTPGCGSSVCRTGAQDSAPHGAG